VPFRVQVSASRFLLQVVFAIVFVYSGDAQRSDIGCTVPFEVPFDLPRTQLMIFTKRKHFFENFFDFFLIVIGTRMLF
jgi:hypothetical protein